MTLFGFPLFAPVGSGSRPCLWLRYVIPDSIKYAGTKNYFLFRTHLNALLVSQVARIIVASAKAVNPETTACVSRAGEMVSIFPTTYVLWLRLGTEKSLKKIKS